MVAARRVWLSYKQDWPDPTPSEALLARVRDFPSWYLRIECAKCGRERYLADTHLTLDGMCDVCVVDPIDRMRHSGCGGQPNLVELVTVWA
jgi:hypothetical protein